MHKYFAGFIMTYERPEILASTIAKVFAQSMAPQKLVIVDNSESEKTKILIESIDDPRLEYVAVGYNAGPAGAAKVGLQRLASEGYEWIYWGDDNDPPNGRDTLKDELNLAEQTTNVGIIGEVGVHFNKYTGRTSGYKNKELQKIMDADAVAGGRQMIVSKKAVDAGILPTEKLFFGFEELDFCIKVKKAGFRIIFDGEKMKAGRSEQGNHDPNYKWRGKTIQQADKIWRQYYSSRNMLSILFRNRFYFAYFYNLSKIVFKPFFLLRFGYEYGAKSFNIYWGAVVDHFKNNFGKKDFKVK
jgi:glycosyltransferase involved in cell wall biosynthesis